MTKIKKLIELGEKTAAEVDAENICDLLMCRDYLYAVNPNKILPILRAAEAMAEALRPFVRDYQEAEPEAMAAIAEWDKVNE